MSNTPIRGSWLLHDCRWSWHGVDELYGVILAILGDGHSIVLVPESRGSSRGIIEAGGIDAGKAEE